MKDYLLARYIIFLACAPLALLFFRIPGIDFSLSYEDFKKEMKEIE